MWSKTLKSTTIIPSELYVERSADRQLRKIIDEMGRPGYVLVARQMGKTNLLINMKREQESDSDVVLYCDLSNRSDSLRNWLRTLIDTAGEARPKLFAAAMRQIAEQRRELALEPILEFGRHLRMILREVPRKLIIVLDEIDSLVSASYSDQIFSQIRSIYFSRVTYPEYQKLTYVLSGVAEPSDLIKDKNVSPFNIGEKIYLDDFSRNEFTNFLTRARLPISADVADAIYAWTGGNPRMTWDLCSDLEDRMAAGEIIDVSAVDGAVSRLYLTDFSRAPVDHIRTLVAGDPQIRDAVIAIKCGKGDTLDDRTRSRLYLVDRV